jgi:signal transduction histidine kinase
VETGFPKRSCSQIKARAGSSVEATSVQQRHDEPAAPKRHDHSILRAAIVGQLAGGILHDFNNVLTVITGTIDILAEAVADRPELVAITRLIDQAAVRGAMLTSHLLAFARGRAAQPIELDVDALLREASRLLRPALGGIEIVIAPPVQKPLALADPAQLMAAVLSLAVAARNAMPDGGRLVIGVEAADGDTPSRADGDVAIGFEAHGYKDVAEYAEQFFTGAAIAGDFLTPAGGRVIICASADANARAEIHLPRAVIEPAWLAGD